MGRTKRRHRIMPQHLQIPYIKYGIFKAADIRLEEAAINNLVLRVRLIPGSVKAKEKPKRKNSSRISGGSLRRMIRTSFKEKILNEQNSFGVEDEPLVHSEPKNSKRYYLKFVNAKYGCGKIKLNVKELADAVSSMKLPSESWHVTVMMNTRLVSVFNFTNPKPKRSVSFSESNPYFKITMDGVPVALLGCPESVDTVRDVEMLLDIVHSLSPKDCMVLQV